MTIWTMIVAVAMVMWAISLVLGWSWAAAQGQEAQRRGVTNPQSTRAQPTRLPR